MCRDADDYGSTPSVGSGNYIERTTIIVVDIFDIIQQARDTVIRLKVDDGQVMADHTRK